MVGTKTVRLAIVGCGEVTMHKHLPALRRVPGVEIAAVADLDENRRNAVGQRFGIARRYVDASRLLDQAEVDAVGVCVPPARHAEVALAAIRAGKHVWIDKPLTLDRAECVQLLEQSRRSEVKVMVGFHMRFHRLVQAALPLIRSGALGAIETIRCVWNSPRRDEGIPSWRRKRDEGGGALIEIGVHHYDLWRFLLASEVREVFARSRDGARDDEAALVSAVMDNGVLAAAVLSERTSHEIEVEISGSQGRLRLSLLRFDGFELYSPTDVPGRPGTRLKRLRGFVGSLPVGIAAALRGGSDYLNSYRAAWNHFVNAIALGGPVQPALEDGVRATEVLLAVAGSRAAGRPVLVRGEA
jgi:predicted dehydrogenase